jgi:hypothetical protein
MSRVQQMLLLILNLVSRRSKWCTNCGYPKYDGVRFPTWKEGEPAVPAERKWLCPFCDTKSQRHG